jgi:hypothetical protein
VHWEPLASGEEASMEQAEQVVVAWSLPRESERRGHLRAVALAALQRLARGRGLLGRGDVLDMLMPLAQQDDGGGECWAAWEGYADELLAEWPMLTLRCLAQLEVAS